MRKLYLFVNAMPQREWLDCLSLTDDGYILGNHICSHMHYMIHDLHNRPDRLEKVKNHFKDEPYEVEAPSYEDCKNHEEFKKAVELANKREQDVEKAGATVTYTN